MLLTTSRASFRRGATLFVFIFSIGHQREKNCLVTLQVVEIVGLNSSASLYFDKAEHICRTETKFRTS